MESHSKGSKPAIGVDPGNALAVFQMNRRDRGRYRMRWEEFLLGDGGGRDAQTGKSSPPFPTPPASIY